MDVHKQCPYCGSENIVEFDVDVGVGIYDAYHCYDCDSEYAGYWFDLPEATAREDASEDGSA